MQWIGILNSIITQGVKTSQKVIESYFDFFKTYFLSYLSF